MYYISGPSLESKTDITVSADAEPLKPPENLFLGEPDAITKLFRIGRNGSGTGLGEDRVLFQIWAPRQTWLKPSQQTVFIRAIPFKSYYVIFIKSPTISHMTGTGCNRYGS